MNIEQAYKLLQTAKLTEWEKKFFSDTEPKKERLTDKQKNSLNKMLQKHLKLELDGFDPGVIVGTIDSQTKLHLEAIEKSLNALIAIHLPKTPKIEPLDLEDIPF